MKSLDMVIVVSISGLAGTDESLRLQAWGTVTNLLRPELGKLYRQFNPSNGVWEHKISRPFGVVLGKQEPEVFRQLLAAGEEAQREAVAFHTAGMLRKADLGGAQKIGDMLLCSTVVDGSDPELLAHTVWNILIQEGAPIPDCGIYYVPACEKVILTFLVATVEPAGIVIVVVATCHSLPERVQNTFTV